jgi:hypothetical protein
MALEGEALHGTGEGALSDTDTCIAEDGDKADGNHHRPGQDRGGAL